MWIEWIFLTVFCKGKLNAVYSHAKYSDLTLASIPDSIETVISGICVGKINRLIIESDYFDETSVIIGIS
jgi:uncharacterized membrane protein